MKSFYNYWVGFAGFLLVSCATNVGEEAGESPNLFSSLLHTIAHPFQEKTILTLTPAEYVAWVQEQNGVTFDSVQNAQYTMSLTFHPPRLEAYLGAVNNQEDPKSTHAKYLNIQKDYYYCMAECAVKYESASASINKNDLLEQMKQQLTVVKNNKDTLHNVITEAFPSYIMRQPNKLLILIPNTDSLSSYKVSIAGSPFLLPDCTLNLSRDVIQSFPIIKL